MKKIFNRKTGVQSVYLIAGALALVLVMLLNIAAGAIAERYPLTFDLTSDGLFGLSDETVSYIETLQDPVTIQVLATEDVFENNSTYNAQASEIMRQFEKYSDAVDLVYVDYVSDPTFASKYPDMTLKQGDIIVSGCGRDRQVKTEELFNYTYDSNGNLTIASSRAEEAILSAVLYVTSDTIPGVAVVSGHGETASSAFTKLLSTNNYNVEEVNLLTGTLPEDAQVIALLAPTTDLSPEEIELLDAFLKNNGEYGRTLLYCASPEQAALPNLEVFLAEWGVAVGDGLVFETDPNRVYSTQPFYAIADYVNETYAAMVDTDVPMLVPVSRPLEILFTQQENYYTDTLLEFGASSGVRPSDAGEGFTSDDATRTGPMPALVQCSYRVYDSQNASVVKASSSVLVSGSVEMLASYVLNNNSFANAQYLTSVLNSLCERTDTIAVTPKTIAGKALNITQAQADTLGNLFVFVIPLVTLALGAFVWLSRRHK